MATIAAGGRIPTLDIVRGVAVMGILAMNIIDFAMPTGAYNNPKVYGGSTGIDMLVWLVNFVLVDGKMRGLFSFLFGASMLLVIERAIAKGESPAAVHYRRMAVLLLFGLAHLYLVWWGDILQHYALIGAIAFAFRGKSVAKLLALGAALLFVQFLVMLLFGMAIVTTHDAAVAPGADLQAVTAWQTMKEYFGPLPPAELARELALHRGSYGAIFADRLDEHLWSPIGGLFQFGWETLAYMLFGMAALKSGFLTGAWDDARYRRWAVIGYAIGIPAYGALAGIAVAAHFDTMTMALTGFTAPTLLRPPMIVAHAALIILLTRKGGALVGRIGAAGRAAFSNYLGTSLIATTLFYGYGVGLFGHLSRAQCYLVVVAIWALMLLWSKPWLDRFQYGPMEWVWRSLSRGCLQPMRRQMPARTS